MPSDIIDYVYVIKFHKTPKELSYRDSQIVQQRQFLKSIMSRECREAPFLFSQTSSYSSLPTVYSSVSFVIPFIVNGQT
jgi:hypothetical protein